jgi:N-acetylmuramoyl-L-alanine amidase
VRLIRFFSHPGRLFAAVLLPGLFPLCAAGAPFTVKASVAGQDRAAAVDSVEVQGVAYLPLSVLLRQLGGNCQVSAARVQAELSGKTALIGINDIRVNTSRIQFSLAYPVLSREGDAWVAQADLEPLLSQAFQISLVPVPGETVAAPEDLLGPKMDLDSEASEALAAPPIAAVPPITAPEAAAPPITVPEPAAASAPAMEGSLQSVVIDAGHGGNDPGSIGTGGLAEKDLTLAVALHLRRILKETTPLKVHAIREKDVELTIAERANRANQQKSGLLISIHAGVSFAAQAHGFEAFCPAPPETGESPPSAARARTIAESVMTAVAAATGAESRGVHDVPLRVFRELSMPGFLLEVGVLSNPAEEALLATEAYQVKIAEGIARGLQPFLDQKQTGETPP